MIKAAPCRALVNGKWKFQRFEDLKVGQLFEMFQPTRFDRSEILIVERKPEPCWPEGNYQVISKRIHATPPLHQRDFKR